MSRPKVTDAEREAYSIVRALLSIRESAGLALDLDAECRAICAAHRLVSDLTRDEPSSSASVLAVLDCWLDVPCSQLALIWRDLSEVAAA